MSRLVEVARRELATQLQRPMLWILLLFIGLMTTGLATGNVRIATGNAEVGGAKAFLNSEFAIAQILSVLVFLFFSFFATVAAGMSVIRDDEAGVGELLHATPLRPGEYIWGKFLGAVAALFVVLGLYGAITVAAFQLLPLENADEIRGPFRLLAYARPLLLFGGPAILFFAGTAFAVGERTRRAIPIFVLPLALLLLTVFFLFTWSPSWLDPRLDRLLMILEPAGFRWLNETWLKVDRGVEFYNTAPIPYDWVFWLNRLWQLALALLMVATSVPHCRRVIAGEATPKRSRRRRREAATETEPAPVEEEGAPLAALGMSTAPPGLWRGSWAIARAELRELRHQPGLYLFVPLILLQVVGTSLLALGAFDTPLLLTSGTLAVRTFNTLTLLVSLLLLFYTVESLARERATGMADLLYSTPLRTGSILFGKALANSVVGVVIVLAALLAAAIALAIQGRVPFELEPFALVWGLLLVPTYLVWSAFVATVYALARDRYSTYALALGALFVSGYAQFTGDMSWPFNWNLWSAVTWSDIEPLGLNGRELLLNRLAALGATVLFVTVAVRLFERRGSDAIRTVQALHPRRLVLSLARLAPFAATPVVLMTILALDVRHGFQGEPAEKRAKDYWRKNTATYTDFPLPALEHVEIALELFPDQRSFAVTGSYRFRNHRTEPLDRIPLTAATTWSDRRWTLDGAAFEPEDRAGLYVFHLPRPLGAGDEVTVGFSHRGRYPEGATKNGGGAAQFILPHAVVLHTFGPSFVPVPGYNPGIGVDEDNRYDSREYPEDHYKEVLEPGFGSPKPFTTHIEVTAPTDLVVNSVGRLVAETVTDGRRTVVWESDHPVKILNVVAGRWEVKRQGGTAVFYAPEHPYNVETMSAALVAARRYYSEWFHPYPWQELKLSEFPNLATYAQGFPTNITFSEGIGFLTKDEPGSNAAFLVTAHEAAHQWWGNLVTPGDGPGGNILSEGMAHYSTLLLHEQVHGLRGRIEFAKRIESRYAENRVADSERPLVKIDGSRPGDQTVTYDKGGWVMWMTHQLLGRDRALAGLQEFQRRFIPGPDHPLLEDLVETLRPYAPDPHAYDAFVRQWFFDVVVPEYRLSNATTRRTDTGWVTTCTITNAGSGTMPVEIAVARGTRFPGDDEPAVEPYQDARSLVTLGAGASATVEIASPFEPERVLVDPDALVLQLEREKAIVRF